MRQSSLTRECTSDAIASVAAIADPSHTQSFILMKIRANSESGNTKSAVLSSAFQNLGTGCGRPYTVVNL